MQDSPTAPELLEAVIQFLQDEVEPLLADDPRLRFRILIAANVLKIIQREITGLEPLLRLEWHRLAALTGQPGVLAPAHPAELQQALESLNRQLCQQLRTEHSEQSEQWQAALFEHLQATTLEKLQIANPRLLQNRAAGN